MSRSAREVADERVVRSSRWLGHLVEEMSRPHPCELCGRGGRFVVDGSRRLCRICLRQGVEDMNTRSGGR